MTAQKTIIGRNVKVDFGRRAVNVPAKVDTGADSSSVWASNVRVDKDGVLKFSLFGKGSPHYNGKVFRRTDYSVAMVKALFSLSDRAVHNFPVLIGRRTLSGKFLVDVSMNEVKNPKKSQTIRLNKELAENPHKFYKKYHKPKDK